MVLVPSNESKKIQAIDECINKRFDNLNTFDLDLFPLTCKKELIPHLAFLFDIDISSLTLDESRKLLNKAITLKKYAGSVYALKTAIKSIVKEAVIKEWFDYSGEPYHFKVHIDSANKEINSNLVAKLNKQIQNNKNVRSVLDELILSYVQSTTVIIGSAAVGEAFCETEMLKGYEETLKGVQNISIGCIGETFAYAKNI